MTGYDLSLTAWGVRGAISVSRPDRMAYGCNTSCWSLELSDRILVFDGGTGIIPLADSLAQCSKKKRMDIFISHFHYDHIMGLLGFSPFFDREREIHIYGERQEGFLSFKESMEAFWRKPFWPVGLEACRAEIVFHEIVPQAVTIAGFAEIVSMRSNHPGKGLIYRVEAFGKKVIYGLDCQMDESTFCRYTDFAAGADWIIYDANFIPEDMEGHRGWGHSSWNEGLKLKEAAGAAHVIMSHFGAEYEDCVLAEQEKQARELDRGCLFAREGMVVSI